MVVRTNAGRTINFAYQILNDFSVFFSAFFESQLFVKLTNSVLLCSFLWAVEGIYESPAQNSQIQKSFVHPFVFCTVGCEKSEIKTLRIHWKVLV